ncbi:hypothetical protein [Vibrio sp. 10N.247.311.51]|uniref:hypothetical protein n=1 Tax=Vibrio sp. 10N.247.311.51 TaxID=3229996 RepID=UPI00355274B7
MTHQWFKKAKHSYKHKGATFEWDTAAELGEMVAKSSSSMPNPYDPNCTDFDDFAEAFRTTRESMRKAS